MTCRISPIISIDLSQRQCDVTVFIHKSKDTTNSRYPSRAAEGHTKRTWRESNLFICLLDFKYLGYRISEYKSDLETKLQTYNNIFNL